MTTTPTQDDGLLGTARALGAPVQDGRIDWEKVLTRSSFLELDALGRAKALLDDGEAKVLCGPFDRLESPWLADQDITPQADDGLVVARGAIGGHAAVVISIDQAFQGGGAGEVSGAKFSQALRLAADESENGDPVAAVLLLETGGVRLQEANLGLNAVAEICSELLRLRPLAPVIGVTAGKVGCFGGVAIAMGLCTRVIVTPEGRIGLNGASVIEQEGGPQEFDSSDRTLIWAIDGGEQRRRTGLADTLVTDDAVELRQAVSAAIDAGVLPEGEHRSQKTDVLQARIDTIDPADAPQPAQLPGMWGDTFTNPSAPKANRRGGAAEPFPGASKSSSRPSQRGRNWITGLAGPGRVKEIIPSVLRADTTDTTYLAVVPDPNNPFYRARQGQVGLTECAALAQTLRQIAAEDATAAQRRTIVAIVDLPSQAYGRNEEMFGLHQAIACAVDAADAARIAGHPLVTLVVGQALSGGFLTHGLQASRLLALDDPGVQIQAMHKQAAAHITQRTVAELDELALKIPPMSFDVKVWATLGFCNGLLKVDNAEDPTDADVETAATAIATQAQEARNAPTDLSGRLDSPGARKIRKASRAVRETMTAQWGEN
ncbi:biotin-independent malonate decarboxylase subunit beta [Streptomyces sp. 8L]|uniref:biotin-independent malonate decarboxylase subunit beta n=1 Tax=Streptomyces sp. 8L TaxID=2877242 RepID=UPI001CD80669|nr:biotin-independent malonate decarboxylase subunit beta [Streptomyces sp. 8L]MCA1219838.1 biotin-independent malonate decarboxylase subunit beta [Streptomyces sp. 8L]